MKILAIDTSTLLGSVAISDDDTLVACVQQGTAVTHSERLIAAIDHLMASAGWRPTDIGLITVANGPGSFTGLRIGIATAKGLARALGCPLIGVSSLDVLAHGAALLDGRIVAVIDARRSEVYAAGYEFAHARPTATFLAETVCAPEALAEQLDALGADIVLVGDGARRYRNLFSERLGARAVIPDDAFHFPHAAHLAQLGRKRFVSNGADDLVTLVPNYVRVADAEIGFAGRHAT